VKVSFRQAGGFTGLVRGCELETADLSAEDAERLSSLVERCLEGEAPAEDEGEARDLISYEIVIEGEGRSHRLTFSDQGVTSSTRPLLEFLSDRSAPQSS
jgi:hypothetical protein